MPAYNMGEVRKYVTTYLRAVKSRRVTFRGIERARIMCHYMNGTIYSGIITRRDIKFVMVYFNADIFTDDDKLYILKYVEDNGSFLKRARW